VENRLKTFIARAVLVGSVFFFVFAAPAAVVGRWSSYGPWFTRIIGFAAHKAAPSQGMGSTCDGFESIRTFSILFGLILLLNYRRMGTFRFCGLYLSAVLLLWIHNAGRVAEAVVLGRETHFGTSVIMILALTCGLALVALRTPAVRVVGPARVELAT
jgi:hypothetical protein